MEWTPLAPGVGPAGLELDRSRTGRLHKNSLRPFGIDTRPLKLPDAIARGDALADAVNAACRYAEALVLCRSAEEASEALKRWRSASGSGGASGGRGDREGDGGDSSRPVLENWEAAKACMVMDDDIQAFVSAAEAEEGAGAGADDEGVETGAGRRRRQLYGDDGELKANAKGRDVEHFSDAWQLDGFAS